MTVVYFITYVVCIYYNYMLYRYRSDNSEEIFAFRVRSPTDRQPPPSSQSYTMRARLYHRPLSVPPRAIAGDMTFPRSRRRRRRRSTLDGIGRSNSRCKTLRTGGFFLFFILSINRFTVVRGLKNRFDRFRRNGRALINQ